MYGYARRKRVNVSVHIENKISKYQMIERNNETTFNTHVLISEAQSFHLIIVIYLILIIIIYIILIIINYLSHSDHYYLYHAMK